jgi:pimeloyl-ACP methyl ester carboxylesterase
MITLMLLFIGIVLAFILLLAVSIISVFKWLYDPPGPLPTRRALAEALLPAGFRRDTMYINGVRVHSICSIRMDTTKPNLLFLHGTGSYALIWRALWPFFGDYNIYAVDTPDIDFLKPYIEHYNLTPVTLVGHFYGAYTALCFTAAHPEYVDKVVLADCIGILPVQGAYAAYWAAYFASSPLQRLLRHIGPAGVWLLQQWTRVPAILYECYMLMRPTDQPVIRKIYKNWWTGRSYWKEPAIHLLAHLKRPVCLVYGEYDSITPAHQGHVLAVHFNIPIVELPGVGHNIMSGPVETVQQGLRRALTIARIPNHRCELKDIKSYADWNVRKSKKLYRRLYATLCLSER